MRPAGFEAISRCFSRCFSVSSRVVVAGFLWFGKARAQTPVSLTITNSPGSAVPDDFIGMGFETGTLPGGGFFTATNSPLINVRAFYRASYP